LMEDVVVEPVVKSKQLREFFNLPQSLYREDPNYVVPLRAELSKQFDKKA